MGKERMDRRDDMHFLNASEAFGVPIDEVTTEQRRLAKLCAFGAPDGAAALENLKLFLRVETGRPSDEG
jgi:DNA polymerase I-like protein with 3'-5' exonuclease and polymerase domains